MSSEKTILVDIATLFDLRMGSLLTLDETIALEVTTKEDYYSREIDTFKTSKGLLTRDDIFKMCSVGKKDLLMASMATAMPIFLLELCQRFALMSSNTPLVNGYSLTINTYPFTLSEDEQAVLKTTLLQKLNIHVLIHVLRKAPVDITPVYLRESVLAMVLYEYEEWINLNHLKIQKKPINDVAIYVPKLCRKLPSADEQEEFRKHGTDIFRFAQLFYAPLIAFQYLDIGFFSVDNQLNKKGLFYVKKSK